MSELSALMFVVWRSVLSAVLAVTLSLSSSLFVRCSFVVRSFVVRSLFFSFVVPSFFPSFFPPSLRCGTVVVVVVVVLSVCWIVTVFIVGRGDELFVRSVGRSTPSL